MTDWEPRVDYADRPRGRRRGRATTLVGLLSFAVILLLLIVAGFGAALYAGVISFGRKDAASRPPPAAAQTAGAEAPAPGAAASPQPQANVTRTATYDDWIFICVKVPNGEGERCAISQQLSDAKTKTALFLWRIAQDGKGGLIGEWQTRTGIMINRGIVLDAGTEKPITIPFQLCTPEGCQAVANLGEDFIAAIGKAEKATATVFPIGGNPVQLALSVKGLAQGLAALKQP